MHSLVFHKDCNVQKLIRIDDLISIGPIPWLMMGEILPAKIRGSAASVATGFNWSCTFIVTKTFNDLIGNKHSK